MNYPYPYTVSELIDAIYQDDMSHFDNASNDCDCAVHTTLKTILQYQG